MKVNTMSNQVQPSFANIGKGKTVTEAELSVGDTERFAQVESSALSLVQPFAGNDFMQSVILGGLCNQADFLIQSKNDRIDEVVGEIRELREMSKNTEIDINQMERKLNWLTTLTEQREETEMYRNSVYKVFKQVTGKTYVKPSKGSSAAPKKRDLNMTMLQVDNVLAAAANGNLTKEALSEEAAIASYNGSQDAKKGKKSA